MLRNLVAFLNFIICHCHLIINSKMCVVILNFDVIFSGNSHLIATVLLNWYCANIMMFGHHTVSHSNKASIGTLFTIIHTCFLPFSVSYSYKLLCNDTCGTPQLISLLLNFVLFVHSDVLISM